MKQTTTKGNEMVSLGKEANEALAEIKTAMYHCLDTADREKLTEIQKRLRRLQQLGDGLDTDIRRDIEDSADRIAG